MGDVLGDRLFRRGRIVGLGLEELRPSFRLGDTRTPGDVRRLGAGRRADPICGRLVGEVRPRTLDRRGDRGRASLLPPLRRDPTLDPREGRVERLMVPPDLRALLRGDERRGATRLPPDRCDERGAVLRLALPRPERRWAKASDATVKVKTNARISSLRPNWG
ncbi:MAG: hypothetical protein IID41_04230 [Planctomycetes bacterium]|nr:hypothetical protein [Planctomycetota bacterium]